MKAPALLKLTQKTIIIEVVESHGCSSLHKVGDKFYFDGPGNGVNVGIQIKADDGLKIAISLL